MSDLLYDIMTPLGITVRCRRTFWENVILHKHPVLRGREGEVGLALSEPDEVRRSRRDPSVLLFYRGDSPRWTCAVTKVSGLWGVLVTAYPTDAIKIGDTVWTRSN